MITSVFSLKVCKKESKNRKLQMEMFFKDSLKSDYCILILQRCMGNIEKKMEGLFIATKNTKESQIKGEL